MAIFYGHILIKKISNLDMNGICFLCILTLMWVLLFCSRVFGQPSNIYSILYAYLKLKISRYQNWHKKWYVFLVHDFCDCVFGQGLMDKEWASTKTTQKSQKEHHFATDQEKEQGFAAYDSGVDFKAVAKHNGISHQQTYIYWLEEET